MDLEGSSIIIFKCLNKREKTRPMFLDHTPGINMNLVVLYFDYDPYQSFILYLFLYK